MACSKAEEDPYLCQPCSIERTALLHLCPVEGCKYETDRKYDLTRHSRRHSAQPGKRRWWWIGKVSCCSGG